MKSFIFVVIFGMFISLHCQNIDKCIAFSKVSQNLRCDSSLLLDVFKLKKGRCNIKSVGRCFIKENTNNDKLTVFMLPLNCILDSFEKFNCQIDTTININDGILYSDCNIVAILFLIDTDPIIIKADVIYRNKRLRKYDETEFVLKYFESGLYMFGTHVYYTYYFENSKIKIERDIFQLF